MGFEIGFLFFLIIGIILIIVGVYGTDDSLVLYGIGVIVMGVSILVLGQVTPRFDGHMTLVDNFEIYEMGENGYKIFYWYEDKEYTYEVDPEDIEKISIIESGVKNVAVEVERSRARGWIASYYSLKLISMKTIPYFISDDKVNRSKKKPGKKKKALGRKITGSAKEDTTEDRIIFEFPQ